MAEFRGTDAGEVIVGTGGDDSFYSSGGQDILSGEGDIILGESPWP